MMNNLVGKVAQTITNGPPVPEAADDCERRVREIRRIHYEPASATLATGAACPSVHTHMKTIEDGAIATIRWGQRRWKRSVSLGWFNNPGHAVTVRGKAGVAKVAGGRQLQPCRYQRLFLPAQRTTVRAGG
jgi:hypothetical protein